jgi:hypothetical protein
MKTGITVHWLLQVCTYMNVRMDGQGLQEKAFFHSAKALKNEGKGE